MADRSGDEGVIVERVGARCPGWRIVAADLGGIVPAVAHRHRRLLLIDLAVARRHWRPVVGLIRRIT